MALVLKQVRRCDGSCCRQSPRFPNARGDDCIYHINPDGKDSSGCQLMTGEKSLARDGTRSIPFPTRDEYQVYVETCVEWPQKNSIKELGNTGNCCYQYVEE